MTVKVTRPGQNIKDTISEVFFDASAEIKRERFLRVDGDTALAGEISSLTATVNQNTADILTEQGVRSSADSALASDISSLTTTVNQNTADITTEQTARSDGDSALASDISSLTATVGGHTASISSQGTAISTLEGNAAASYVMRAKAGGASGEIEMVAFDDADNGASASSVRISADNILLDGSVKAEKISVTSLSAISATLGTFKSAATGERIEITDDVIKVYDASNTVRVKIGDLS